MFKWGYAFVEENLRNGSIQGLFAWIEWVTLTGIVFAVGLRFSALFLFLAAVLGVVLYYSALIGVTNFVGRYAAALAPPRPLVLPIAFGLAVTAVGGIFAVLVISIIAVLSPQ